MLPPLPFPVGSDNRRDGRDPTPAGWPVKISSRSEGGQTFQGRTGQLSSIRALASRRGGVQ